MSSTADHAAIGRILINGSALELEGPVHTTALDFLRRNGLTGCKEGCAEGECGACAILVARPEGETTRWTAINACLVPAAALEGQEIVTAEGLGDAGRLHPVQHEMAVRGGSQCGYCTPGFICSMAAEFYRPERAEDEEAGEHGGATPEHGPNGFDLHALSGNLCRCTGYRPIRDAACALGLPEDDDPLAARRSRPAPPPARTDASADGRRFRRPSTLAEALAILREEPDTTIVAGSTDWGVEVGIRGRRARSVLAVDRLEELRGLHCGEDAIELGAALTLSEIERGLAGRVPLLDRLIPGFASRLIRNSATLGGNLGTGSPIGDSPPVLLALEASLVLASADGEREVPLAEYFTGYRRTVRRPDELIAAIRIPRPLGRFTAFHKIAKRRFDDISSVAVAYALEIGADGRIAKARIGLGGVAATPLRARAAEDALEGRPWSLDTIRAAAPVLAGEGTPMTDHRASAEYRSAVLRTSPERLFDELGGRDGAPRSIPPGFRPTGRKAATR
ncbi:xanthine dehydrogenase small subunit [Gulosibacter sp. 10]|uniref:xanthine dehydrogenase small subunit n=1 Tax=Gulosibacter sp. 10 TaxID=1255570 RepID=UPI00097EB5D3|nr:FAD binding domain-containing protein [Gulosibacter sp. 10]SJM50164.1 Xanthine dehydrogenase, iron-sulfur cluster and FAD-binding subunit A [Gulosibacter sp. 10]